MCLVKKGLQAGQVARFAEGGQQVVAVALVRVGLKVGVVPVARQGQTPRIWRAAQPGAFDQLVVFHKAQKHAAEQPVHARLGDDLVHPALKGFGAALGVAGGLPFGLQAGFEVGQVFNALQQVGFQAFEQFGEVDEELGGVDHCECFQAADGLAWLPAGLAVWGPVLARCLFSTHACGSAKARVLLMLLTRGTATPSMVGRP